MANSFTQNTGWRIFIRILLLFITITAFAFLLVKQQYVYLILIIPVIAYQLVELYRFQRKAQDELQQFVE